MEKDSSETEHDEVSESKLRFRQLLTALGPLMGILFSGMLSGYSAVLIPQLKGSVSLNFENSSMSVNDTNDITVSTTEEESWIASSFVLPMAPGCWFSGLMMEKLGRRKSVMLVFPSILLGWLIIGFANNFTCLVVGRLISGFCAGLLGPLAPVYISETSDPVLRGILLSTITLCITLGIFFVHIVGIWLHWRTTVYICAVVPIISWLACFVARESPSWLLNKGRAKEAQESWIYLRGQRAMDEYLMLENMKIHDSKSRLKEPSIFSSLKKTMSSRYFLKPLGILCLYFFTAQFSGNNVVIFYSIGMIADVAGPENAFLGCLIIDVIRMIFSTLVCFLTKKCTRRTLSFVSGFGTAFNMLSLSLVLFFEIGKPWVPALFLVSYTAFMQLGWAPLPWMLCGELFPRRFRGLGSGFTSGFTFICFFAVVKIAPGMFESLEVYGVFAIYGTVALVGSSLLYLTLPETKDKTLEEIERSFDKNPKKLDTVNLETLVPKRPPAENACA